MAVAGKYDILAPEDTSVETIWYGNLQLSWNSKPSAREELFSKVHFQTVKYFVQNV